MANLPAIFLPMTSLPLKPQPILQARCRVAMVAGSGRHGFINVDNIDPNIMSFSINQLKHRGSRISEAGNTGKTDQAD